MGTRTAREQYSLDLRARQVLSDIITDIPRSRSSDPETSHLAEKHMKESGAVNAQCRYALNTVRAMPGKTAREYGDTSYNEGIFHRRLVELERKGLVRRGEPRKCRISGRQAHTWYPTEVK